MAHAKTLEGGQAANTRGNRSKIDEMRELDEATDNQIRIALNAAQRIDTIKTELLAAIEEEQAANAVAVERIASCTERATIAVKEYKFSAQSRPKRVGGTASQLQMYRDKVATLEAALSA